MGSAAVSVVQEPDMPAADKNNSHAATAVPILRFMVTIPFG